MTRLLVGISTMRFTSFFSSGFITAIVINLPERKLAKRTSVLPCQISNLGTLYSYLSIKTICSLLIFFLKLIEL